MTGKSNVLIAIAAIVFLSIVFLFTATGFYCKVPTKGASPAGSATGETVWFLTRGTDFPFISSADGIAMEQGFSPNDGVRGTLDAEFEKLARKKILARFGFSRTLYMMTTNNTDFYSPDEKRPAEQKQ